jgi:hypothetical protein
MLFDPGLNVYLEHTGTQTLKSGLVVLSYHAKAQPTPTEAA